MAQQSHISIGRLGEDVACGYLKNRNFEIVDRNYRKKWGEIDIVAKKDNQLHFVEVKSGTVTGDFPRDGKERYRPEDHMTSHKCARLARVIQTYLSEHDLGEEAEWTVDLVVVLIHRENRKARVHLLTDIVLS